MRPGKKNELFVPVTTTIPARIKAEAAAKGVTIQSLVMIGWEQREGMKETKSDLEELREKIARMSSIIEKQQVELWSLKDKKEAKR